MGVGIFSWFGFALPMAERARMIRDAGFQSVMLWWGDDHRSVDGPKEAQPELFRKTGLRVVNVHTPFNGINNLWLDNLEGQSLVETLLSCIDDCGTYEIPAAVVHLSHSETPPAPGELGFLRIERLLERAERKGVDIALENLRQPSYLDHVFQRLRSDRLKFCYDSGHANCWAKGMDLLPMYGDKLVALHLHDNDGTDDQHRLPFDGTVRWPEVIKKIQASAYRGDLTLELNADGPYLTHYTAESYLSEAMARAQKLLALMA